MKRFASILLLLASLGGMEAQTAPPDAPLNTHSISGQFFVRGSTIPTDLHVKERLMAGGNFVQLDSSLLAVSSERIKQLLWRKLGTKPIWRGQIHLELRPARSANDNVRMVMEKFSDGWRYRVVLPEVIEREKFVRAITQVLLLEIVNRGAIERSTELPLWFVEGFTHELLTTGDAAGELKIFLPPPTTKEAGIMLDRVKLNERRTNSLYWAHVVLSSQPPLTFEQLSWPTDDQLATEASEVYQSCAQLFVVRLLEFKDGPASFRAMLVELPKHLNWQIAFLNAFKSHFTTMLDVEKWWAVQVSHFTDRELQQNWSYAESWQKLDDAIRAPVKVSLGGGAEPLRTEVTMQTLLRDANGIQQEQFYRQKLDALNSLRMRSSPEMIGIVDDYRAAITAFLNRQQTSNPFLRIRKFHELAVNRAAKDLIHQLDVLETKRAALKPAPASPANNDQETISAAFR